MNLIEKINKYFEEREKKADAERKAQHQIDLRGQQKDCQKKFDLNYKGQKVILKNGMTGRLVDFHGFHGYSFEGKHVGTIDTLVIDTGRIKPKLYIVNKRQIIMLEFKK